MTSERRPGEHGENEGEGSRTADERYRRGLEEHLRRGTTEQEAEQARRELEERPEELRRAEEAGKRPSRGDLPEDLDR
jgi:hypothetical protein